MHKPEKSDAFALKRAGYCTNIDCSIGFDALNWQLADVMSRNSVSHFMVSWTIPCSAGILDEAGRVGRIPGEYWARRRNRVTNKPWRLRTLSTALYPYSNPEANHLQIWTNASQETVLTWSESVCMSLIPMLNNLSRVVHVMRNEEGQNWENGGTYSTHGTDDKCTQNTKAWREEIAWDNYA